MRPGLAATLALALLCAAGSARAGEITGILPLVHVKTRLFGNGLISTGFTVGGGPAATTAAAVRRGERQPRPASRARVPSTATVSPARNIT